MNSRVSWNVEGIEPAVRERAEAAARQAGMSLGDWLNSSVADVPQNVAPHGGRGEPMPTASRQPLPQRETQDVAEIHQRLDSITRQIDQISRPAARGEPGVARQLNDAISRLDARLSQISDPAPRAAPQRSATHGADMVERAAAQVYSHPAEPVMRALPPLNPGSLDFAIAEISARQNQLDGDALPTMPSQSVPPLAPVAAASPDMSGLEQQLFKITSQIEALQLPDGIEQSIAAFRAELADIRAVITEAMPRHAIESIENEIRSLTRRIDDSRQSGTDAGALAGVERALNEIHAVLRSLTPAEHLAGFDDAIRSLGGKIDLIVRSTDDPQTLQQLESAIGALRAIVPNVASNEALSRLSDDVHTLSSKVDQLAYTDNFSESFAALEQRIAALTSTLENRERPAAAIGSEHLEGTLRALSDRLDHMAVGQDSSSTFAHLEQRVAYLLERLESATDGRSPNLSRVEDGLQDILRHLEQQHSSFAALGDGRGAPPAMDSGLVDTIKRELSDMRFSQSETDRHTQDSLEVVHSTLGHVVDRLSMIEGDLRAVRTAPVAPATAFAPAPQSQPPHPMMPAVAAAPPARPAMPNPVQSQLHALQAQPQPKPQSHPESHFDAAPRDFAAAAIAHEAVPALMPKAISDILDPAAAGARAVATPVEHAARPIDLELPPDHPLEPGTKPQFHAASPSERIAASENAISELPSGAREPASASSFIAAARRAAQAAAAATPGRNTAKPAIASAKPAGDDKSGSTITSKIRSLLVGASVVVIVLGSFKMAMTLLDATSAPVADNAGETLALPAPAPQEAPAVRIKPATPAPAMPSMTSPTPIGRQSMNAPAASPESSEPPSQAAANVSVASAANEVTGTIVAPSVNAVASAPSSNNRRILLVPVPATERLPDAIGGPALRTAALKGDAAAAYEVGVRYAEGKGVTANYDEAAKWYDRAAQAGLVPAMFRLGTLYEKGLSVKKDIDTARRYYMQAAERGNAKAMHNLAVLDADGGARGANYKSASQWFRKAADRGVADSQFNLGILYARGIGVEQNLAESFKWFSLAAAQGDADSARKRDDISKRLDPQSLAAAKLAIQTFVPEPQPDDAINVTGPAGGWDVAPAQASAKPASAKRAAR